MNVVNEQTMSDRCEGYQLMWKIRITFDLIMKILQH